MGVWQESLQPLMVPQIEFRTRINFDNQLEQYHTGTLDLGM
jgi:hypothetical protein